MCSDTRVVARHSRFRLIARCNCSGGTVHISWDAATFHLNQTDFEAFKKALYSAQLSDERYAQTLWLGTVGLLLTSSDHHILCQLVSGAARGLPERVLARLRARALN